MADERTYIIPFRKEYLKVPRYKRSQKAIATIKVYLKRHMKADVVKIGFHLNKEIHKHGKKNPPIKVKVKALKEGSIVKTELPEFPFQVEKKEEKKSKLETLKEKVTGKKDEKVPQKIKEIKEEEKILEEKGLSHKKGKSPEKMLATPEQDEHEREKMIITKSQKPIHEKKK